MPIPECEKSLTISCAFFKIEHQSVTDRETDGQTDGFANTILRSACIACWRAIKTLTDIKSETNKICLTTSPCQLFTVQNRTWNAIIKPLNGIDSVKNKINVKSQNADNVSPRKPNKWWTINRNVWQVTTDNYTRQ